MPAIGPGQRFSPAWHAWAAAVAAVLAVTGVFVLVHSTLDASSTAVGRDFLNLWSAAKLSVAGESGVLFDLDAYRAWQDQAVGQELSPHFWSYPPHLIAPLLPFAWLALPLAYVVWSASTFAAFAGVVLRGLRAQLSPTVALYAVALAPAALVNLYAGQTGFLTAALWLGGMLLLRRHPIWAGVLFGLLTVKPQLGVAIPILLLARREPRPLVGGLIGLGGLAALSFAVTGPDAWRDYWTVTMPLQREVMESWTGIFSRMMPTAFMAGRNLGLPADLAYGLQAISTVSAAVLLYGALRREKDPARQVALTAVATFLMTPYAFSYDLPLLAGALLWLTTARDRPTAAQPHPSGAPAPRVPIPLAIGVATFLAPASFLVVGSPIGAAVTLAGVLLLTSWPPQEAAWDSVLFWLVWTLPILLLPAGAFGAPIGPLILWLLFVRLRRPREASVAAPIATRPRRSPQPA